MATEKAHAKSVSRRFIKAMKQIIADGTDGVKNLKEFAEKVGEYPQNISRIEAGTRYPTIEMLCIMCLVFKINPGWVLLGRGEMKAAAQKKLVLDMSSIDLRLKEIEKMISKSDKIPKKKAV